MNRLRVAGAAVLLAAAVLAGGAFAWRTAPVRSTIVVWKSPTCGCCHKWIQHLQAAGFSVVAHDTSDLSGVLQKYGVPDSLVSCHTATVEGYVVEGHVPADLIQKLLTERPNVAGLAVPGMPVGSPGMEEGDRKDPYDVVAWDRDGKMSVYARR